MPKKEILGIAFVDECTSGKKKRHYKQYLNNQRVEYNII